MNYKITMIIEALDSNDDVVEIFNMGTEAGMADFEENIIRKGEHAMKEWEAKADYEADLAMERAQEDLADMESAQHVD